MEFRFFCNVRESTFRVLLSGDAATHAVLKSSGSCSTFKVWDTPDIERSISSWNMTEFDPDPKLRDLLVTRFVTEADAMSPKMMLIQAVAKRLYCREASVCADCGSGQSGEECGSCEASVL